MIPAIMSKIVRSSTDRRGEVPTTDRRANALAMLLALSELRNIRPQVERDWKAMGITLNLEDSESPSTGRAPEAGRRAKLRQLRDFCCDAFRKTWPMDWSITGRVSPCRRLIASSIEASWRRS
jgi:hypothetical protein